jgi:hypothetical protein
VRDVPDIREFSGLAYDRSPSEVMSYLAISRDSLGNYQLSTELLRRLLSTPGFG